MDRGTQREDSTLGGLSPRYPYAFVARLVAAVGTCSGVPALPPHAGEYVPIRWFGRTLAVLIVAQYTQVPPGLRPYSEVIAAVLVRRGFRLATLPLTMLLDDELPVELGRRYFSLPKRLEPALRLELSDDEPSFVAPTAQLRAAVSGALWQSLAAPARLLFALAVRLVTTSTAVVGALAVPVREARIAVRPRGLGRLLRVNVAHVNGLELSVLWAQRFDQSAIELSGPKNNEGG